MLASLPRPRLGNVPGCLAGTLCPKVLRQSPERLGDPLLAQAQDMLPELPEHRKLGDLAVFRMRHKCLSSSTAIRYSEVIGMQTLKPSVHMRPPSADRQVLELRCTRGRYFLWVLMVRIRRCVSTSMPHSASAVPSVCATSLLGVMQRQYWMKVADRRRLFRTLAVYLDLLAVELRR